MEVAARAGVLALGVLVAVAIAAVWVADTRPDYRGEPIFRYVAVTLWASWAVLIAWTAYGFRLRWSAPAALITDGLVAAAGAWLWVVTVD